jgi:hypothetical protein
MTPAALDYAKTIEAARQALTGLHDEDARLRAGHLELERERNRILQASPPVEDIVAAMRDVVDRDAAAWANDKAASFRGAFGPGLEETEGAFRARRPSWPQWFAPHINFHELVGLFPELVKARLEAIIRADVYEPGAALAERTLLLADVDRRIAELEHAHEQLVDVAGSLTPPVKLHCFPAVAARREREAMQRQRDEQTAAERKEREAAVNHRHAQRGPSYIQRLRQGREDLQ